MKKLLILGTVAFDEIETPFGKTDRILGGAATYIGLSASFFGVKTGIVSVVGDDFPAEHLEMFNEKGIDTQGIEIVKGGKTFFWKGRYHHDLNSRDTLDTQLNVLENFNPKIPDDYKDAEVLVLGNLHPSIQLDALKQMSSRPSLIILDTMNFWMDVALDDLLKVVSETDIISINDEEARQLSGEYSLLKAARKIQTMGPKQVIIKKGEHGALLFMSDDIFFAPALPLEEVFDPTGAGDTFAGGFSGYLASQNKISLRKIRNATIHGCNMASFCVERFGTERLQMASPSQVKNRLKKFIELTKFDI